MSTRQFASPLPARRHLRRLLAGLWVATATLTTPSAARASLLPPAVEDKVAWGIAIFVLFVVPVALIVLFWMVHVLPEKIAHKRHHPQFEAIRTLCLLSLVFGGLLWPIAWIWAYTKPVVYKMAYGTDKAPPEVDAEGDAWDESGKPEPSHAPATTLGLQSAPSSAVVLALHDRLARLEQRGLPASELSPIRADLDALEAKLAREGR
jgi:uncharacterized membrane protein